MIGKTVCDLVKDLELKPGIPLKDALLRAASKCRRGNHYAYQWDKSGGWYVSRSIPIVSSFFKVDTRGNLYACAKGYKQKSHSEVLAGSITNNQIQMKEPE